MSETSSGTAPVARFCVYCGSDATQKLSVIYIEGTTAINTVSRGTMTGVGLTGSRQHPLAFGIGDSKTRTTGVQQTQLAKMAAPPVLEDAKMANAEGCFLIPMLLIAFVLSCVIGYNITRAIIQAGGEAADVFGFFIIIGTIAVVFIVMAIVLFVIAESIWGKRNEQERARRKAKYDKLKAEWDASWYCHRCGKTFALPSDGILAPLK